MTYARGLNRALREEMSQDESVVLFGEDVGASVAGLSFGLRDQFGPDRVVDMPLSEQGFTGFATGAALGGRRPVVEYQVPSLLLLVLEQIANHAHKAALMSGGQARVPVTYLVPASGSRPGWGAQHSDHPYSVTAHLGVKTVVPATPSDAYGLLRSAIRDDDPVVLFAPAHAFALRDDVTGALPVVPLGEARIHRAGTDVTVVAVGHLVQYALAAAELLASDVSIEVFDPRTLYPFDWAALRDSLRRTGRLVVIDDSNRFAGVGAEILATAAEEFPLAAPPKRVTRPDGAVLPSAAALDRALQPSQDQLMAAIHAVLKDRW
jgi:pyruvate dehydrogenase E1 component beta subunit